MLLKRTFGLTVLVCPRCAGPMQLVAAIEDRAVAEKILRHLGLPTRAPPRGSPWRPPAASAARARPPTRSDELDAVDAPSLFA